MYWLPEDIIIRIYQFDPTFHIYFNIFIIPKIKTPGIDLFKKMQFHNLPVTIRKYAKQWKYTSCIIKKHTIILTKPFGVLATCQNCHQYQGFNWIK